MDTVTTTLATIVRECTSEDDGHMSVVPVSTLCKETLEQIMARLDGMPGYSYLVECSMDSNPACTRPDHQGRRRLVVWVD